MFILMLPYIAIGIPLFLVLYFIFKSKSERSKMLFIRITSGLGIFLLAINKISHYFLRGEHILALLPLHLCYISLIVFMSISVYTKSKLCRDFIFYISSLGALMAIIFPSADYVDGMFSIITFTYFTFHMIIVCLPIWMFMLKLYEPKTTIKNAVAIFAMVFAMAYLIHLLNVFLVKNGVENANYFWTLIPNARKNNNAALIFFANIIPYDFWYLIFAAPILFSYIGIWALILKDKIKKPR